MPARRLLCLLFVLVLTACVVGGAESEESALETPTFEPDPGAPDAADEKPDGEQDEEPEPVEPEPVETPTDVDRSETPPEDDDPSEPSSTTGEQPDAPTPPEADETGDDDERAPGLRSRVTDPRGDTESARVTSGPRYADLVGGLLERHPAEGYRLAIDLDGGAPEGARDGDHTMNVATFYDLTGDGRVDVEVWANLADGGWDTAVYDNRTGEAAFSDDDDATVGVEGGQLVLRFPLPVLDGAERFRWAVASEWGRYEQLGTLLTVRDEMPDDGAPAPFPG